jgi:L-ascorbate metabolism protein UlaG (beta-lactamase superfamily)
MNTNKQGPKVRNRRRFMKTMLAMSAGAGVGSYWLATSRRRSARWLRQIVADARRPLIPAAAKPNPKAWPDNAITICWLGHATTLINFYGVRILTDPAFFSRIGISFGLGTLGPKRYVACALKPKELPPIDLVLLSHAHMDHMDLPSLAKIPRSATTVSAKLTSDVIRTAGLTKVMEVGWKDRTRLHFAQGDLEIEGFEVKHWGQRWPSDVERGYNGYILRREGKAIIFGGDTAHTRLFGDLHSRGPFEAAIMPIAAYQPWIRNHCTPEQAVQMCEWAGARYIVPVHHLAFKLSDEPMTEPMERLSRALEAEADRIAVRRVGESFTIK